MKITHITFIELFRNNFTMLFRAISIKIEKGNCKYVRIKIGVLKQLHKFHTALQYQFSKSFISQVNF